jgi:hypothetical protein
MGQPLALRDSSFFSVVDLPAYLQQVGVPKTPALYELDHLIWVCPSGTVLLMGKVTLNRDGLLSLEEFQDGIGERYYAEFTLLFTRIAEILFSIFPEDLLGSSLCCAGDTHKIAEAVALRRAHDGTEPNSWLTPGSQARNLYDDILVDVYYVHCRPPKGEETLTIGYVGSSLETDDPVYLLVISIAFSSFVGILWLIKYLGEQSRYLEERLFGGLSLQSGTSTELKLFRIFALRLINESRPISIRLTRAYMTCLEEMWKECRLHILVDQVNEQLTTLEEMFNWVEDVHKEARNIKIGIVGVVLAIIASTAATAQLISTFDINSALNSIARLYWIVGGLIVTTLIGVGIYFLPIATWFTRLRIRRRLKKGQKSGLSP